jgi:hypothetical protein
MLKNLNKNEKERFQEMGADFIDTIELNETLHQ